MVYQGGKCMIAKPIMAEILKYREDEDIFVDLFVGGGAVAIEATKHFDKVLANDKHPYIIALLQAVKNGWTPPDVLTEEEYQSIKKNPESNPPLAGFAGFCCSFGGKWMGGYARGSSDYARQGAKVLCHDRQFYQRMSFSNLDYKGLTIPKKALVYADPPYENVTPYKGLESFDSDMFWGYMRELSKTHKVFISEQKAPKDFVSIWSKPKQRRLGNNNKTQSVAMEHLFMYKEKGTL